MKNKYLYTLVTLVFCLVSFQNRTLAQGTDSLRDCKLNIHTNLLYDVVWLPDYGLTSAPNLGFEFYPKKEFGRCTWSVDFEFPHWREKNENHKFFQLYNLTISNRVYFKARRQHYQGFFMQTSINAGYYGISLNGDKGWQGELVGAGIGLGYKQYFRPKHPWRRCFLEIGILGGAIYTRYDPYVYGYDETKRYYYDYTGDPAAFKKRSYANIFAGPVRAFFTFGIDIFGYKAKCPYGYDRYCDNY